MRCDVANVVLNSVMLFLMFHSHLKTMLLRQSVNEGHELLIDVGQF